MKAALAKQYGPPEVLVLEEVATPQPKSNEVLIKVEAAAVNSADWRLRKADPWMVRLFFGLTKPKHPILGGVIAGEVVEVGDRVTRLSAGDKVYGSLGLTMGGYGEFVTAKESAILVKRPDSLSPVEAASVPFGAMTAWHFLQKADVKAGQSVLIYGASGAVGSAAVQMASSLGATVTAVCSTANLDWVRDLGAANVVDYTTTDMASLPGQYDVIFETVNKTQLSALHRKLKPNGRLIIGAGGLREMMRAPFLSGKGKKVIAGVAKETIEYMDVITQLLKTGELQPVVDKRYPLKEIVAAHHYVEQGHKKGNVVVTLRE